MHLSRPRSSIVTIVLVALLITTFGCATTTTASRPPRSEFDDIPVTKGLAYVPDKSMILESPTVKAARLVYRGRLQPDSLAAAERTMLEANGWKNVSSTTTASRGVTQVYDKNGTSLQVLIWEGWWYTYLELTAGRALAPASATPSR